MRHDRIALNNQSPASRNQDVLNQISNGVETWTVPATTQDHNLVHGMNGAEPESAEPREDWIRVGWYFVQSMRGIENLRLFSQEAVCENSNRATNRNEQSYVLIDHVLG